MIRIKSDRLVLADALFDGYLYIENGKITELSSIKRSAEHCYDFTGRYVSPGFIDLHTHGGGGYAFLSDSAEEIAAGCRHHLCHGTTALLATLSACERETAERTLTAVRTAREQAPNLLGAHVEGPYLSPRQCGAQCPTFITPPCKEEYETLLRDHGDVILRWTFAPETDEDGAFCAYLTQKGVLASAGHTDAVYADMKRALAHGCRLVTHLYSCTSTVTRDHGFRSLGVIESTYLEDDLYAEIIADGKHLPPALIRMIVKIKGADRVILCTDSLSIAGTDIKEGSMSGTEFIVEDGVCKLKSREAFAGSIATADVLIRVLLRDCGYDMPMAVRMMTATPAALLGLPKGRLMAGYDADIAVFDDDIRVTDCFVCGQKMDI